MKDIKLIVVTHVHVDHAGSAARLRKLSGAPILAHRDDADFYSRKVPMTFCPTGLVGRVLRHARRYGVALGRLVSPVP
jgi:hydroxyacylglutathione hydrolase